MKDFIVYPAIDLRHGQVVRLREGDPSKLTTYSSDPVKIAEQWMSAGTQWIHIVNLDGAFDEFDDSNQVAVRKILETAKNFRAKVQFGGGMRNLSLIERALSIGVSRVVVGTLAVEQPALLKEAIKSFGNEKIVVGIDARDGEVKTHGWSDGTSLRAVDLALQMKDLGIQWIVFTDIARDGIQVGVNLQRTIELAKISGMRVIASGGVHGWDDVRGAYESGLAGVIVGRAIYEGNFDLSELFRFPNQ